MKVTHVHIENFKRFSPPGIDISLCRPGDESRISEQFLLLGDNAMGKTTVLQAIALTLSLAAYKTPRVDLFRWLGWAGNRYFANGDPVVEVVVRLSPDEREATRQVARRWWELVHGGKPGFIEPGDSEEVRLRLVGPKVEAVGGNWATILQFRGRSYAAALAKIEEATARSFFPRLPGIFWFDQFRNIAMLAEIATDIEADQETGEETWGRTTFQLGVTWLHRMLRLWYRNRERGGPHPERDFMGELETLFGQLFPGRRFAGFEMVYGGGPTPIDDRLVLTDGNRTYDLREMSAGEQSVFPLLFEFVRQQIHHSVILIDEIDLNLHPPLAQRLYRLLPQLGQGNQFLFTTHASAVADLVGEASTHRLPGGDLCL